MGKTYRVAIYETGDRGQCGDLTSNVLDASSRGQKRSHSRSSASSSSTSSSSRSRRNKKDKKHRKKDKNEKKHKRDNKPETPAQKRARLALEKVDARAKAHDEAATKKLAQAVIDKLAATVMQHEAKQDATSNLPPQIRDAIWAAFECLSLASCEARAAVRDPRKKMGITSVKDLGPMLTEYKKVSALADQITARINSIGVLL